MGALTLSDLRTTVRLHRQGVEGAGEQLLDLARTHGDDLARTLGVPLRNLDALDAHDDPAGVLAATIEAAPRVRRELRARRDVETARLLAMSIAERAEHRDDGTIGLDVALLREVTALHPGGVLTFGTRGSVGVPTLRAILREVRQLRTASVALTAQAVVVTYRAPGARGHIRLHLHAPVTRTDALLVPITEARLAAAVVETPLDPPLDPPGVVDAPLGPDLPRPKLPPPRPFLHSLLTAFHDALRSPAT